MMRIEKVTKYKIKIKIPGVERITSSFFHRKLN